MRLIPQVVTLFTLLGEFFPQRLLLSKVLAPIAPIVAVRLWVSEFPTHWNFGQPIGEFLSRRAGTLFFYLLGKRGGRKTGPSIRPLNDIPRPVTAAEPLSGSQTSVDLLLVAKIHR